MNERVNLDLLSSVACSYDFSYSELQPRHEGVRNNNKDAESSSWSHFFFPLFVPTLMCIYRFASNFTVSAL